MKANDVINTIERFFLDIIGVCIPGGLLLLGFAALADGAFAVPSWWPFPPADSFGWVTAIGSAYVLGHASTTLAETLVLPLLGRVQPKWLPSEIVQKLEGDATVSAFKTFLRSQPLLAAAAGAGQDPPLGHWRSLALGLVTPGGAQLTYRFMFISLLSLGVGVNLMVLAAAFGIQAAIKGTLTIGLCVALAVAIGVALCLVQNFAAFRKRSLIVPFGMALTTVWASDRERPGETSALPAKDITRVYLAGGFKSGWQDRVMAQCKTFKFADPRSHSLIEPQHYTAWDLQALRSCQVVLAYAEAKNPGLYALSLEIGYAKAAGSLVLLVDERSTDPTSGRYFAMVRATADLVFDDLDEAINYLNLLA